MWADNLAAVGAVLEVGRPPRLRHCQAIGAAERFVNMANALMSALTHCGYSDHISKTCCDKLLPSLLLGSTDLCRGHGLTSTAAAAAWNSLRQSAAHYCFRNARGAWIGRLSFNIVVAIACEPVSIRGPHRNLTVDPHAEQGQRSSRLGGGHSCRGVRLGRCLVVAPETRPGEPLRRATRTVGWPAPRDLNPQPPGSKPGALSS